MKNKLIAASATAVAALFLVAASVEQVYAQRGGRDGGPSGGPSMGRGGGPSGGPGFGGRGPSSGPRFEGKSPSIGPRFEGRGPSGGRFDGRAPPTRSYSRDGSRSYGYTPRFDRGDGRRHVRRFRGHRFFYGAVPLYGAYVYGACAYYYERALATGSEYWWDRYYACTGGDYD